MDISAFKPSPGFFKFYGEIVRSHWPKMLGVVAVIETLNGLLLFVIAFFSRVAAENVWDFMLSHPSTLVAPSLLAVIWILFCAGHKKHADESLAGKAVADTLRQESSEVQSRLLALESQLQAPAF